MPDWLKLDAGLQHAWYGRGQAVRSSHCGLKKFAWSVRKGKAKKCRKCRHVERFK